MAFFQSESKTSAEPEDELITLLRTCARHARRALTTSTAHELLTPLSEAEQGQLTDMLNRLLVHWKAQGHE